MKKKSFVWSAQCSRALVFMISALLNIAVLNSSSNLNRLVFNGKNNIILCDIILCHSLHFDPD